MKLEPETVFQYGDQWFRIAEFEPVENAELIIKANRASAPGHGGEGAGVSEARVKPLEWVRADDRRWIGNAALPPHYQVRDATWWRVGESLRFHCDTPDEAKAAAQADFDKRIRSALTAVPAPGGDDEVRAELIATHAKFALVQKALELFASHLRGMSHVVQDGYVVHITKDDYERIVAPLSASPAPEPVADAVVEPIGPPVILTYRNWRGEVDQREITPRRVWFGSTEWHSEPQWFLSAYDHDKQADRDFALRDFAQPAPAAQEAPSGVVDALRQINGHIAESAFYSGYVNGITRRELIAWRAALAERQPQPQEGGQ